MALQLTQDLRRITVHRRMEELMSLADAGKHETDSRHSNRCTQEGRGDPDTLTLHVCIVLLAMSQPQSH